MKDENQVFSFAKIWRALLAEFLATVILVFFGCMSCIPIEGSAHMTIFYGSFGFGITAMCCIQCFGHISGSLMNPVLVISVVIWKKMPFMLGVAYIIAECAGAIAGYGLLVVLVQKDIAADGVCVTAPHGSNVLQALGVEVMLSAVISLILCSTLDPVNAQSKESVPIKFGLAITSLALAGTALSGGGMNPVRALGPAVWAKRWESHWVYWAGPLVGGIVPAIFYKYIWLETKEEPTLPACVK